MASKPKMSDDEREQDYQSDRDASTLQDHAEITSDPERHQRAHKKLQGKFDSAAKAMKSSNLHKKVKKGLAKAFPKDDAKGSSPFQKDAASSDTPFDKDGDD